MDTAVLFLEKVKVNAEIEEYLRSLSIDLKPYAEVWNFLRVRDWGEGKVGCTSRQGF
jgi:Xaa-Pro aminopeptidase